MLLLVTLVAAAVAAAATEQSTLEVTLKQGAILGSREEATNGRVYYSFRSIPYAKPPVGPLRFKDPEPAPAWSGVRNGSLPIPKCPQTNFLAPGKIDGQEDCLYLDVYTPSPSSSGLPVMVYIHGGGFILGAAMEGSSPAPLMQKDVVVVGITYRLGSLGFLSTGDSVLPGNLGLKDQTMALRWVQDNIRDFGGDPMQVTIFGVSAGGVSVHFQILSPGSEGLFQRAILHSGTALVPETVESPRRGAIAISKALNCTGEESQQLLACFTDATLEDLVNVASSVGEWNNQPIPVAPCVDGVFLPDHPAVLIKEGYYNKVDMMSGTVQDEGNVMTAVLFSAAGKPALQELNDNFTKAGPIMLKTELEEDPVYLARRLMLKDMAYNTDFNITSEDEMAFTKLYGDRIFQAPNVQTVEFHAKEPTTKTFMYQFDHLSEMSIMSIYTNASSERPMAGHGDDIMYMFQLPAPFPPMTSVQDLHVRDILVTLWTNFAATGNPTVNGTLGFRWTPVDSQGPLNYLSLTTSPTMKTVDSQDHEFWSSLPTKITKVLYPERFREE